MKAAETARVSAEVEASARRDALKHRRAEAHSLKQESAAAEEQSRATLAAANERVRSATARAAEGGGAC